MTTLIKIFFLSCVPFLVNCQNVDFSIIGHWKVDSVELIDKEGVFKDFCIENDLNFDDFVEGIKMFEEVEFIFKENEVLEVINPEELGGNGNTDYQYSNGSDVLIFGGRNYGFRMKSTNEISIIDYALGNQTQLIMHCIRQN